MLELYTVMTMDNQKYGFILLKISDSPQCDNCHKCILCKVLPAQLTVNTSLLLLSFL